MKYSASCIMLEVHCPQWDEFLKKIDPEDVLINEDSKGLEEECHITVLYGILPEVKPKEIVDLVKTWKEPQFMVEEVGLFENEKFDVLKLNVRSLDLGSFNEAAKQLPYESKFPVYHPHMTVGYLKPGTGRKYLGRDELNGKHLDFIPVGFKVSLAGGQEPQYVDFNNTVMNFSQFTRKMKNAAKKESAKVDDSPFVSGYATNHNRGTDPTPKEMGNPDQKEMKEKE